MCQLAPGERLMVWSWRLIVTGRIGCPLLASEFKANCGDNAGKVFCALCTFLCALAQARRRRLQISQPGWPELTADEQCLLALVAAAQNERQTLLEAHLCWIARREPREVLEDSVWALAAALDTSRLRLSLPACEPCRRVRNPSVAAAQIP